MSILFLTLYLYLAHFLADFIFQPVSLVEWKYKSIAGLLLHVGIHWICYVILLSLIFTPAAVLITATVVAFTHLLIDQTKIIQENKKFKHFSAFWIDQAAHWLVILITIVLIARANLLSVVFIPGKHALFFPQLFFNPTLLFYLILVIFVSKTLEISHFQKLLDKSKKSKLNFDNRRIVKRLFILTLIFLLILSLFSIFPGVATALIQSRLI